MVKGAPADQDRAVAWARDNGINFFDTAASYGNGASETNLGRALAGNTDGIVVSSKVGIAANEMGDIGCNSPRNRREPLPAETGSCRPLSAAQHSRTGG